MFAASKASESSNHADQGRGGQVLNPRDSRQHEIEQIFGEQFTSVDRLRYLQAYAEIAVFLDDTSEVTRGLRALNDTFVEWCDAYGMHDDRWRLRTFLRTFEQEAGFNFRDRSGMLEPGLISLDHDNEIVLGGFLDPGRFMTLVAAGITWDDPTVEGYHGALTHRIQWWLINWALSERFDVIGVRLADLYREIGDHFWPDPSPISPNHIFHMGFLMKFFYKKDWTEAAKAWTLWDYLLDLPEGTASARSPDFLGLKFFYETDVTGIAELRKAVEVHQK